MATGIFPPLVNSSQPAFTYDVSDYIIYFTLPDLMSLNSIKHIQIRLVKQTNNRTIVNTSIYPDGIIYKSKDEIGQKGSQYTISINLQDLESGWSAGELYKVQLRFGTNVLYNSISDFANWKKQQIEKGAFSEWSTVMAIKAINEPVIEIKNATSVKESVQSAKNLETSLTPLIIGACNFVTSNRESVDKYKFILYNSHGDKIEDSGWLQHNASADNTDSHRFSTVLENGQDYSVIYQIVSINGYEISSARYNFQARETYLSQLVGVTLNVDDSDISCIENACLKIYINSDSPLSGNYVLIRTSEKSNYTIWEDLNYFLYSNHTFVNELIYTDYTIENGIKYKYAFQQENSARLRTSPLFEIDKPARGINFEHSYLYKDGVQLKLEYNFELSSFKHSVLESKSDTLGSKYPTIFRNGHAYYAEFPISGLISFHMDDDNTFFELKRDGYYYKDKLIIPFDNIEDNTIERTIDTNLTHSNIFIEKIFRDKVEEFLNDGSSKLYKSATEGNIIINLMNISLSPEKTLSRMIYKFSATAYEVADFNLSNLNNLNIIDIGNFEEFSAEETVDLFGQLNGMYVGTLSLNNNLNTDRPASIINNNTKENLLEKIKEQVEYSVGGGYRYKFNNLTSIWVEQYPVLTFEAELRELNAERADLAHQGLSTKEVDEKIAEYNKLIDFITTEQTYPLITLVINGKDFSLGKNKVFVLQDVFDNLSNIYLKYSGPIIINYTCKVTQVEDISKTVQAIETSLVWGQLAGVFTSTDKTLLSYNFRYNDIEQYQIPDINGDYGNINFDLFKSENIFDIVKEKSRFQIEEIYDIENGFSNYDKDTDTWDNGTIFYNFTDILSMEIEADQGSVLLLDNNDGSTTQITIGATEKYVLNPSDTLIKGIRFEKPTYAIINYKCATMQTIKNVGG